MEREQESEWKSAQSIATSVDLVSAAKTQLKFLAAVDRNRWLYEGPGLDSAIYRYNAYWLPLLAKHSESQLVDGPLVVPLDCEWVWHCHRLNPARYKQDCEEFYGKILDNQNVVSSVEATSTTTTKEIWKTLFASVPYELDFTGNLHNTCVKKVVEEKCTKYDLISAVQRQSPFFYQVSRSYMIDDRYLAGAVARYKAFLHLIKRNKERSIKSFSVPTYDIDLIWHSHQLHPVSYCNDLMKIMGKILEHDDTDSDRTKGQKLDVGFSGTTKTFEEMYGYRYWRAGGMYRGGPPSPVRTSPYSGNITKKVSISNDNQKITLSKMEVLEVMLEFVGVRNLPGGHKGSLIGSFSKTQPDAIFNAKRSLTIFSETGEKQVASFQCQPTGSLLFELLSLSSSSLPIPKSPKTMGTSSISLEDFLYSDSNLILEKWVDLVPSSNIIEPKPIGLRVAISVTLPTTAPYVLHMIRSRSFLKSSCLFPLPLRVQFAKSWTNVVDEDGNLVVSLQMRDSKKSKGTKSVVGILESGVTHALAEFAESEWSLVNSPWSIQVPDTDNDDGHILELAGPHTVRLFTGGRLDYEKKHCGKHKASHEQEDHLITAVEFSVEDPYGSAVALFDLKSATVKVKEEWFLFPGFVLAFVLADTLRKEGCLIVSNKSVEERKPLNEEVGNETNLRLMLKEEEVDANENGLMSVKVGPTGGGCGGGCGSRCGNALADVGSGRCGGCGGGNGCGNMAKCGGCGGSCGDSGGCGAGCRNMAKCSGCCGGAGCRNMAKCSGCCVNKLGTSGGGGGGGCGCNGVELANGNEITVA